MPPRKLNDAKFSEDKKHRFVLWRIWDKSKPCCLFIGLNPSTADTEEDDRTTQRMKGFAEKWGLGGYYLCNLFSCVSTNPEGIVDERDDFNREWVEAFVRWEGISYVVACWGANPRAAEKKSGLVDSLRKKRELHCICTTQAGDPGHPLYKAYEKYPEPQPWHPPPKYTP